MHAYKDRLDIHWLPSQFSFHVPDDFRWLSRCVFSQLMDFVTDSGAIHIPCINEEFVWNAVMWSGVESPELREYTELADELRARSPEEVFIPIDKDPKRRARMSIQGYWVRLFACFFCDPAFYHYKEDYNVEDLCKRKMKLIHKYIPFSLLAQATMLK